MEYLSSSGGGVVSPHLSAVLESLMVDLEPTPFREGASLVLLPGSDNIFVPSTSSAQHAQDEFQNSHPHGTWEERFQELLKFKAKHGHCLVPHVYRENPPFARWAKRQRFQYKLFRDHKPSVMTDERIQELESVGFVWCLQGNAWETQLMALVEFKTVHGHCNVPCRYRQNPALGAWVKRQRRMYKKYMSGAPTNVPEDRFRILSDMGFQWEIASARLKKTK